MATLENVSGASLVPNIGNAFQLLFQHQQGKRQQELVDLKKEEFAAKGVATAAEAKRQQQVTKGLEDLLNPVTGSSQGVQSSQSTQSAQFEKLIKLTPGLGAKTASAVRQILESRNEQQLQELDAAMDSSTRTAFRVQSESGLDSKRRVLNEMLIEKTIKGEDTTTEQRLINMDEEQLNLELQFMTTSADVIRANVAERLRQEKFETLRDTTGDIVGQRSTLSGRVVADPRAAILQDARVRDSGKASAVTKIYDNGTTVQALPNGEVIVKRPDGSVVEGVERIAALKAARKEEIEFQKTQAGAKSAGKLAIEQADKAFTNVTQIKKAIENIDAAIAALDEGASTGFVQSKLPSIRASSVRLDNIQKRMGLDIVGVTTFGALSKGELDLALSAALPTRLNKTQLKEWLIEKKSVQEKLANYLQDVAVFLGTPGNTVAGWVEIQRELQGRQSALPEEVASNGIQSESSEDIIRMLGL